MYQQYPNHPIYGAPKSISRLSDGACIPFDPDNTDYQTFKYYLEGKDSQGNSTGITPELKDPEGNDMTQEQITAFLGTLP
jgi:hypothetical protein